MGLCILTKYGAMEHNNFLAGSKTDKDAKREKMKIIALGVRSTHTGIAQGFFKWKMKNVKYLHDTVHNMENWIL